MRASTGLGLIAIVSLLASSACATTETITLPADGTGVGAPEGTEDPTASADPTTPGPKADPTNPDAPPAPVLDGISVTNVAVFQAVKVPVVQDGVVVKTTARKAPVVAQRPGLIRIYVTPGAGWKARDVTAELRLIAADGTKFPIIRESKKISIASTDEDTKSTFNLEIPADSIPLGVKFQVSLTGADGKAPTGKMDGRFPRDGSLQDLGTEVSGKLKVVIVPVKYTADGSGRIPDVSAAQLDLYKKTMMSRYPASEVEVTVRAPYTWSTVISRNGGGFDSVLSAMHQLRQADKVAKDVYYYGALVPSSSFSTFCQSGCVTGLSTVVDNPTTAVMRASVGIGYAGTDSANTMAHEVGHAHGREHAPCGGADGIDPDYPYTNAVIGVWGYDIFAKTLISPTKGHDMMAYCPNEWVSDYTYNALFERIQAVSTAKMTMAYVPGVTDASTSYRIATVNAVGDLSWNGEIDDVLDQDVQGGTLRPARFTSENGVEMITRPARFFKFDHLPGGLMYVPKESATQWKAVQIDGYNSKLYR